MQRHLLAILAVLLFAGAAVFRFWPPEGPFGQDAQAACWRLGVVLGLWWLAYEQVRRSPKWVWLALPLLMAVLVIRPKWFLFALPVVIALIILRPRGAGRR